MARERRAQDAGRSSADSSAQAGARRNVRSYAQSMPARPRRCRNRSAPATASAKILGRRVTFERANAAPDDIVSLRYDASELRRWRDLASAAAVATRTARVSVGFVADP